MRVDHEKKSDGVRVDYEKESDGLRVYREKERWGETSPYEGAMALELTMRERARG